MNLTLRGALAGAVDNNPDVLLYYLFIRSGSKQRVSFATGVDIARLDAQLAGEQQQASASRYTVEHAKLNLLYLLALPYETPLALTD